MKGLTNGYVEKLGKKLIGKNFLGVFPCDLPPNCSDKINFSVIFNTARHDKKGEHFIAIFANAKTLYYFDSFGKKCGNKLIKNFITENIKQRDFIQNDVKIQNDISNFCGFYAIAFLISRYLNKPLKTFLNLFHTTKLRSNDKHVIDFIINFIDQ